MATKRNTRKHSRRARKNKRRSRRLRRKQRGGDGNIPSDMNTVVTAPPGGDAQSGDPDSVATPQSLSTFEENSSADPDKPVSV